MASVDCALVLDPALIPDVQARGPQCVHRSLESIRTDSPSLHLRYRVDEFLI